MHIVAACLFALCTTAIAHTEDQRDLVRTQVSPLIENGLTPGIVVGTIANGERTVHAFGVTEPGSSSSPDGETIYEIGSVTKVLTGVLLADAVLESRLSLDESIGGRLPLGVAPPAFEGRVPTLTHLATHTAGFPRLPVNIEPEDMDNPYRGYTIELMWQGIDGLELGTPPGERYAYSNLGTSVLGHLVAVASGMSYERAIEERVAGPLGMNSTTITLTDEQRERLAPGTLGGVIVTGAWDLDAMMPAGGLRSTADDMLAFAEAALSEPSTPAARAVHHSMEILHTPRDGSGSSMAMGWHIAPDGCTRWHNGQTGGSQSFLAVDPEHEIALVLLTNSTDPVFETVAQNVLAILRGERPDPPTIRSAVRVELETLQNHAGVYRSEYGFDVEVEAVDGDDARRTPVLLSRVTGQLVMRLWPISDSTFFYRSVPAEAEFLDENGDERSDVLVIVQGAERIRCERVE